MSKEENHKKKDLKRIFFFGLKKDLKRFFFGLSGYGFEIYADLTRRMNRWQYVLIDQKMCLHIGI